MKRIFVIIMISVLLFSTGCQWDHALPQPTKDNNTFHPTIRNEATQSITSDYLPKPITDLEFWIAENVEDVDFSTYQEKYGMFGGTEYYGTGYTPTIDEDGNQVDPEYCVIYTVTSYPDYSSMTQQVTSISITDPSVEVYTLTLKSSQEDINTVMENEGFEIEELGGNDLVARKGDYTFTFSSIEIRITVNVTNQQGIVF